MEQRGPQEVLDKLGANATGLPFNSGLAVELTQGAPENPLVNAGAMSTVSLIAAKTKPNAGTTFSTTLTHGPIARCALMSRYFNPKWRPTSITGRWRC